MEEKRAVQGRQRNTVPRRSGHADGRCVPPLLASGLPLEQIARPDCDPLRVEILGERLVAFRDTAGKVGLLEELCPHRGVSLALGRNEESGLRCLYHGWKFAVDGTILDMPNCPGPAAAPEHQGQDLSDPRGGRFPVGLSRPGRQDAAVPNWRFLDIPVENMRVNRIDAEVNYMQQLEGGADTSHVGHPPFRICAAGLDDGRLQRDTDPDNPAALAANGRSRRRLMLEDTPFGFHYAAIRQVDGRRADGQRNVRVVPIIMPSTRIIPSPAVQFIVFEVPMNDTRTATFAVSYRLDGAPVDQWKLNEMSGRRNPALFDEATHRYSAPGRTASARIARA